MTTPASETIGFIGLGFMGHGMAKNIVEKGYPLTVMGRSKREAVDDLVKRGATEARTAAEVAAHATIVFLCVTGSQDVEAIVRGETGLASALNPARSSSIVRPPIPIRRSRSQRNWRRRASISSTRRSAGRRRRPGKASSTPWSAASEAVFARLKPVLETWAGQIVHIGAVGDGHRMKLLNNFLSLGYAALYSEASALSQKVGISPERFDSVIRGGRMDCGFYQTFMRWTLEGDRDAHKFTIANAFKDLRYLEAMADAAGFRTRWATPAKNSFALAHAAGGDQDYVPMLPTHIGRSSGVDLAPKKR